MKKFWIIIILSLLASVIVETVINTKGLNYSSGAGLVIFILGILFQVILLFALFKFTPQKDYKNKSKSKDNYFKNLYLTTWIIFGLFSIFVTITALFFENISAQVVAVPLWLITIFYFYLWLKTLPS